MKTAATLSTLVALASFSAALPKVETNWESYVNELGYTTRRFKPGMEPGSLDYELRFGAGASNATTDLASMAKRQEDRSTQPVVGQNAIPYGCRTDIPNSVLNRVGDICGEFGCDGGSSVSIDVTYPNNGNEEGATVTLVARGNWPSGMRDAMIQAVQAEAIPEAVEIEEVASYFQQNSPYNPGREYRCDVSKSSNFFQIAVRNNNGQALVALLDVDVTFTQNRDSIICGTVANAAGAIGGAISGIGGAFFGALQAIVCQ